MSRAMATARSTTSALGCPGVSAASTGAVMGLPCSVRRVVASGTPRFRTAGNTEERWECAGEASGRVSYSASTYTPVAMPIYEYRRPDGTTFEVIQKFSDDPLAVDPESGVPVERVLSAPAIHFKGSGFHNTDYGTRRRNREKAAQEGGSSSSGESSSSSGSSSSSSDSSGSSSGSGSGSSSSSSSSDSGGSSSGSSSTKSD